jgi:putative phosphoesterase
MPHNDIIGVISDTHGLVRPEVIAAFKGVGLILHAGDIGGLEVLEALREISPVRAIRGNNDQDAWARGLKETEIVDVNGVSVYLLHNVKELDVNPSAEGYKAVISGHSHQPSVEEKEGVLFINPGSAGPRRFKLPVSVGFIRIEKTGLKAEIKELSGSRAS